VSALLAAMQRGITFRASPLKVGPRWKRSRAIVTARGGNTLHQAGEAGPGYLNRGLGTGMTGPIVARGATRWTSVIHIAPLSVFTFAIHGGFGCSLELTTQETG
jgi:hypothetical protein